MKNKVSGTKLLIIMMLICGLLSTELGMMKVYAQAEQGGVEEKQAHVLIEENFNAYPEGIFDLTNKWIFIGGYTDESVSVTQNTYGHNELRIGRPEADTLEAILTPIQAEQYSIETRFRFAEEQPGSAAILFGGSEGEDSHLNALLLHPSGSYQLVTLEAEGMRKVIAEGTTAPLSLNQDYLLRLNVYDHRLTAELGREGEHELAVILDYQANEGAWPKGQAGIGGLDGIVYFDSLRASSLAPLLGQAYNGAAVVSLTPDQPYVLATTGEPVELQSLTFQAQQADSSQVQLNGGDLEWQLKGDGISIVDGYLEIHRKGVYIVDVVRDEATAQVLLVAKNANDLNYVLYEEDFEQLADGTMPEGWTRLEKAANAGVKAGGFEIDATASPDNPSRVLLPDYLHLFGDYKIEADMAFLKANENTRWNSLMFRIQNNNYPYYQMAVRKNAKASNGVEFAERNRSNNWHVIKRGAYQAPMEYEQTYQYTVKVKGNRVQESIDNHLIIDTDTATAYTKGGIGLQANGSALRVENIRITLLEAPLPPLTGQRFVQVMEPDTQIAMAPSVITELQSSKDIAPVVQGQALPATLIIHVNRELQVTDASESHIIGSLDEVLDLIGNRMIPAFYLKDERAVSPLTDYLVRQRIEDAFVIAADGDLVKQARSAMPMLRGIVDYRDRALLSEEELLDVRRTVTVSGAKIALLSSSAATRYNTEYLQQRTIVVWAQEDEQELAGELSLHRLITAGVNGMVTARPEAGFRALEIYDHDTTLVRKPYLIGHRGMPANSPENTLESNRLAYEAGADFIENDMYLSKDQDLVIIHDSLLSLTTNGWGNVEDYTVEELKKLNANRPYPRGFPDVKIPTLGEQLDLVKDNNIMLYAEIKTSKPQGTEAFVRIVREKDAESAVNLMSFNKDQLQRIAALMPEMPLGLLVSGYASENNVLNSLRETLKLVQPLNATFNTSYSGLGEKFLEASKHRGLLVSPWTLNTKSGLIKYFKMGAYGLTTDYALWMSDWAASVNAQDHLYTLRSGQEQQLVAEVKTYDRTVREAAPEVVVLDGGEFIEVNGDTITAKGPGVAHVVLRYTATAEKDTYDLYTEPVTIIVAAN
ncbi:glycerophosphodiester phosphodiesterase family protein [Paenibacillus sanguinis]|uniref:glycerophosphodiester phosphodiesterase family protein n=1 Tax=Paenibacillus sanguinis TaxID=225906 RepID=UPI00036D125C|nr:glycerophosphodiester phosphodiesterase family protein [Paenibacillus sanguinis]